MRKILLAFVVLFSACSGGGTKQEEEAQDYELITVKTRNQQVDVEYAAQIRGMQDIRIIPRVEGYLQRVLVKEGEIVKKGQLLFVIDQIQYLAAVKSAKAAVLQATALAAKSAQDYEGKKMLREKNVISEFDFKQSKSDLDVANAKVSAARAELESAQNNLSFTELKSPSDGVVGRLPYRKGDFVGPSTTEGLTVVSDNKQMCVYFSMTESNVMQYLGKYPSMRDAIAHTPALTLLLPDGKTYEEKGRIESISGIVDNQTGAVSVRAVFPNESGRLLSGGTARIVMPQIHQGVVVIPQESTFEIQDKVYVYKVIGGKASSAIIEVERIHDGKDFIVTKGLKAGEVIIAKGVGLVREGTKVRIGNKSKSTEK